MSTEQSTFGGNEDAPTTTDGPNLREDPPRIPHDWRSPEALRHLLEEKNLACRHVEYIYEAPLDADPDDVDGKIVEKVARSYGIPKSEWGCRVPSGRAGKYFRIGLREKRRAVR